MSDFALLTDAAASVVVVENGMLTPSMKKRRRAICTTHRETLLDIYGEKADPRSRR